MQRTRRAEASILDIRLDRLLGQVTWEGTIYLFLLALAFVLRFWDLGRGVLHHDEITHAWDSWNLYSGRGYTQDPKFHGPLLYHANALVYYLLGVSDYTARLVPAILGTILVGLPYFARRWLGRWGALTAAGMLVVSPSLLYYSRHLRHDIHLALFTFLLLIFVFRYLEEGRSRDLYLTAAALAFTFSTKEASFIIVAILGTFLTFLVLSNWLRERRVIFAGPEFDLVVVLGTLSLAFLSPLPMHLLGWNRWPQVGGWDVLVLTVAFLLAMAVGFWWNALRWTVCAVLFYAIFIPLYTTFCYNPGGIVSGFIGSLAYWFTQQGVRRGNQPWFYYLILLPLYEFLPLILGLVSAGGFSRRLRGGTGNLRDRSFLFWAFCIYWLVLALIVFSWAGEKMPWLTLHMALPLVLLSARFLGEVVERINWSYVRQQDGMHLLYLVPLSAIVLIAWLRLGPPLPGYSVQRMSLVVRWTVGASVVAGLGIALVHFARRVGAGLALRLGFLSLVGMLSLLTFRFAYLASFRHSDIASEMLIYTQSTPDVAVVMEWIEAISQRLGEGKDIVVAYDNEASWPFEWYLRDYSHRYFFGEEPTGPLEAPIVLVGLVNEEKVKPYLDENYLRRQYRLRWWFPEDYGELTVRKLLENLRDSKWRERAWGIAFYREVPEPLGSTDFVYFERKDLGEQVWKQVEGG